MFIAENTRNGYELTIHDTAEKAVQYLIDSLSGDYSNDFRVSDCGNFIVKTNRSKVDFCLSVKNGLEGFGYDLENADPDFQVLALRALADAIEKLNKE